MLIKVMASPMVGKQSWTNLLVSYNGQLDNVNN